MNKIAVVTGASGFVGKAVLTELLHSGYEVWAIVRPGSEGKLPSNNSCNVVPCDLGQLNNLINIIGHKKPDYFFHFAWDGSAGDKRFNSHIQLANVQWTLDACHVAKALGCKRFIVSGSIMEKETIAAAYAQGNKPGLGYVYGSAKVVAHAMVKSLAANLGIELLWAMITNAYGVGERSPRLVNTSLLKCLRKESPRFTSAVQNYDFVYIDDVARAFRLIAENGLPFHDYLIGSGQAKPLRQFFLQMKEAVAPDLDFIFGDVPFTGIDLPLSDFDCKATEFDTGFKAKVSFDEGCRRTFEWLKTEESKDGSKI